MARYVMANRRAGRFREPEKRAARAAIGLALNRIRTRIDIVHDHNPPGEVEARASEMPSDVIVEPEILPWTDRTRPRDFIGIERRVLAAPAAGGATATFGASIRGDGQALEGTLVILFLRGFFGLSRQLEATTGANGAVSFDFGSFWTPSALIAIPAGDFWSVMVRGPANNLTIDCPRLPITGPLAWWHHAHGVTVFDAQRGDGIRVGVADTGVGPHPCLNHVQDIGAFIDGAALPGAGADVDSHGSHVCGIIGARPLSAGQFAGMAPGATLISARVFPPNAGANQGDIVNAIDELSRTHQVDFINLSLGAPQPSQIEQDAIRDALERGTLCICAAANSAGPVEWPAAFPETVAVSALGLLGGGPPGTFAAGRMPEDAAKFGEENLYLANFSCFGPEITCSGAGVGIISTVPARFGLLAPYVSMDGTSMASPSACGTLAALLSANPDYRALPRDEMRAQMARVLIQQHCRDIGLQAEFQGKGVPELR